VVKYAGLPKPVIYAISAIVPTRFFINSTIEYSTLTILDGVSTYFLSSNITIASGSTLTINPGVTVNPSYNYITVDGTINAEGSPHEIIGKMDEVDIPEVAHLVIEGKNPHPLSIDETIILLRRIF